MTHYNRFSNLSQLQNVGLLTRHLCRVGCTPAGGSATDSQRARLAFFRVPFPFIDSLTAGEASSLLAGFGSIRRRGGCDHE